ncbi:MAG TPA: serine hydrolase [Aggregatilineaceae bacterium]|nr:serine hydrolase [Aggregatilineaceae bacterium]
MQRRTKQLIAAAGLALLIALLAGGWTRGEAREPSPQATPPDVFAEAVGQANLRSGPGIEYPAIGQIATGTRYRIVARHSQVPWLRLDVRAVAPQQAWVFADLVSVYGPVSSVPLVSDFPPVDAIPPSATPGSPLAPPGLPPATLPPSQEQPPVAPPAATPELTGPLVTTLGEANLRFGPGVEYAAIAELTPGSSYRLLEFHALVPWVHIAVPEAPGGAGWVFQEIVEISGDTSAIPYTNNLQFNQPDLTPTPQIVVAAGAPWAGAPLPGGQLAQTLGLDLHNFLLEQNFRPFTDRFGAVFVLDLLSGDSFALNDDVAFSGMSLTKIPILAAYFERHEGPLSEEHAYWLANTMMCSENITTNRLLEVIGDGDPYRGAQRVTAFMQALDLRGTFLVSPYTTGIEPPANATPAPAVSTITTGADQVSAQPDPFNQIVPSDLGWLLAGIYQCAQDGTGLLIERFPDAFTAQECRQMLRAMDANEIGVFLEAGVPPGTTVIHKHGWINDTHGDAGLVIAPDAAYVFVAALYGENWLEFEQSAPALAEMARRTWNALAPGRPVAAIVERTVPAECDARSDPVYAALLSQAPLPAPGPEPPPLDATPTPASGG